MKLVDAKRLLLALGVSLSIAGQAAAADEIKIGLSGTFTGGNSGVGVLVRQAYELFPKEFGGVPVQWVVLDDATDPTIAVRNARQFIDSDGVDAILGSSSTTTAVPMFDVVHAGQTPQLTLSPVAIPEDKQDWIFNIPQPVSIMVSAVMEDMKQKGIKRLAFIGFADGWGDLNWDVVSKSAEEAGIEIVASERYNRNDASVTAPVLKLIAGNPEAVYVGGAGTAAATPHMALRDMGYAGEIYHTHGAAVQAFLTAGGASLEGTILPTGPNVVWQDLPEDHPARSENELFSKLYQERWGEGPVPTSAAYAWDGMLILRDAATEALKTAKPGTPEFRTALRDAMQRGADIVGTSAVYHYTPTDHYGVDDLARVLVKIEDGQFRLYK